MKKLLTQTCGVYRHSAFGRESSNSGMMLALVIALLLQIFFVAEAFGIDDPDPILNVSPGSLAFLYNRGGGDANKLSDFAKVHNLGKKRNLNWQLNEDDPIPTWITVDNTSAIGQSPGAETTLHISIDSVMANTFNAGTYTYTIRFQSNADSTINGTIIVTLVVNSAPVLVCPQDSNIDCAKSADTICFPISVTDTAGTWSMEPLGSDWWFEVSDMTVCTKVSSTGTYSRSITVTDSYGSESSCTVKAIVTVNHAPTVSVPADTMVRICPGDRVCVEYVVQDQDGNNDTVSVAPDSPGNYQIDAVNNQVCFTPTDTVYTIALKATDSCGAIGRDTAKVHVYFKKQPLLDFNNPSTIFLCTPKETTIVYSLSDPDNVIDNLTLIADRGTLDKTNHLIRFTPDPTDVNKVYNFKIRVVDKCGRPPTEPTTSVSVTINRAPTVAFNPVTDPDTFQCVKAAQDSITVSYTRSDPDGNISREWNEGPGAINTQNHSISFVPDNSPGTKTYTLIVGVEDVCLVQKKDTVDVRVTINSAPTTWFDPPERTFWICRGRSQHQVLPYYVTDVDKNVNREEFINGQGQGTLDTVSNVVSFDASQYADINFAVKVTDICGAADTAITLVHVRVYDKPSFTPPRDTTIYQWHRTEVALQINDVKGQLPIQWTAVPETIDTKNAWRYTPTQDTNLIVRVSCTDDCGQNSDTKTFNASFYKMVITADPLAPDSLKFGEVLVGNTNSIKFTIFNPGSLPVKGIQFSKSDSMDISRDDPSDVPSTIDPKDTAFYTLKWHPGSTSAPDNIIVSSQSLSGSATIFVTGTPKIRVNPKLPTPSIVDMGYINMADSRDTVFDTIQVKVESGKEAIVDSFHVESTLRRLSILSPRKGDHIAKDGTFHLQLRLVGGSADSIDTIHLYYSMDLVGGHGTSPDTASVKLLSAKATPEMPVCGGFVEDSLVFKRVDVKQCGTDTLRLKNTSNVTAFVDNITFVNTYDGVSTVGDTFHVEGEKPYRCPPGVTKLPVTFCPGDSAWTWVVNPRVHWKDNHNLCGGNTWLRGASIKPRWLVDSASFPLVPLCDSSLARIISLENFTGSPVTIDGLHFTNSDRVFHHSLDFSNLQSRRLDYGEKLFDTVYFQPRSTLGSARPDSIIISYRPAGTTIATADTLLVATGSGCAGQLTPPTPLVFNNPVELAHTGIDSVTLHNSGLCVLTISAATILPPFRIIDRPSTIDSGGTGVIRIEYEPKLDVATLSRALSITHDGYKPGIGCDSTSIDSTITSVMVTGSWQDKTRPVFDSVSSLQSRDENYFKAYAHDIGTGVKNVQFRWRWGNSLKSDSIGKNFDSSTTKVADGYWKQVITSHDFSDSVWQTYGIEVRVIPCDNATPSNCDSTVKWVSIPGEFRDSTHTITRETWLGGSENDKYWHLVSIPGELNIASVGNIFCTLSGLPPSIGAKTEDRWRILSWNVQKHVFDSLPLSTRNQPDEIEPGKAYAFRQLDLTFDTLQLPAGKTFRTDSLITIPLVSGWNLFSNPFFFDIVLDTSDVSPQTSGPFLLEHTKPGDKFTQQALFSEGIDTARIRPWKGYAAYCSPSTGYIKLWPHRDTTSFTGHLSRHWTLNVNLLNSGNVESRVTMGLNESATDGLDTYDAPDFDILGSRSKLRVSPQHSKLGLLADIRSWNGVQVWELDFGDALESNPVLCWDKVDPPQAGMTVMLKDVVAASETDMTTTDCYDIPSSDQLPPGRLRVIVGFKEAVEDYDTHTPGTRPIAFRMYQNFPNPFNPTTTISYDIPHSGDIALEIYNILGARIRTLADGHAAQGSYTTLWDGKDNKGRPVASGVYFARLRSGDQVKTIRLVLVK